MDKYTCDNIMRLLKLSYQDVVGVHPFQNGSEARSYYLENLNDNLYRPMDAIAHAAYSRGSGNEIDSGKMCALRSSSALTYNLFWNRIASFSRSDDAASRIGAGDYSVEFEKQYHTLKPSLSRIPANIDAFLYYAEKSEAIACEMKMLEWICNKPGRLSRKYLESKNYIDNAAGQIFASIAQKLIKDAKNYNPDINHQEYPCPMTRYDTFQMFKHAVACYTACTLEDTRKITKLTLVNCVWTLSNPILLEEKHREKYLKGERCEIEEFDDFRQQMQPAISLFSSKGVDFDICFCRFNDFLELMEKSVEELNYLRRYTLL